MRPDEVEIDGSRGGEKWSVRWGGGETENDAGGESGGGGGGGD